MTDRIPCTPETKHIYRDLARGLDLTYDATLLFIYETLLNGEGDPLLTGRELRDKARAWKDANEDNGQHG